MVKTEEYRRWRLSLLLAVLGILAVCVLISWVSCRTNPYLSSRSLTPEELVGSSQFVYVCEFVAVSDLSRAKVASDGNIEFPVFPYALYSFKFHVVEELVGREDPDSVSLWVLAPTYDIEDLSERLSGTDGKRTLVYGRQVSSFDSVAHTFYSFGYPILYSQDQISPESTPGEVFRHLTELIASYVGADELATIRAHWIADSSSGPVIWAHDLELETLRAFLDGNSVVRVPEDASEYLTVSQSAYLERLRDAAASSGGKGSGTSPFQ